MKIVCKNTDLTFLRKHVKTIVYKDYWVRAAGQYVNFNDYDVGTASLLFNQVKGLVKCYYTGVAGPNDTVLAARASNVKFYILNNNSVVFTNNAYTGSSATFGTLSSPGELVFEFDNSTGNASLSIDGGTPQTATFTPPSASTVGFLGTYIYGASASNVEATDYSGKTKFREMSICNAATDTLLFHIRPAIVDGVPCLDDDVNDIEMVSADGTTMVLEDAV